MASFTRETGEQLLRASFASVQRIDVDGTVEFADRDEVEVYIRASIAMSPFVDNLPATVLLALVGLSLAHGLAYFLYRRSIFLRL